MKLHVRALVGSLGALWAAGLGLGSCGHSHHTGPVTGACSDPTQVSLPSCGAGGSDPFSDEACQALDDRITRGMITVNDMRAPAVTAPAEGQAVPGATPFTFTWTAPTTRRGPTWRSRVVALRAAVLREASLVSVAYAHCAPFNGRGYELVFRVGGRIVLRRQQSATTWQPDAATWTRLRTAAGNNPVELTILAASFNNSLIATGSGPFAPGMPRRFTITN